MDTLVLSTPCESNIAPGRLVRGRQACLLQDMAYLQRLSFKEGTGKGANPQTKTTFKNRYLESYINI